MCECIKQFDKESFMQLFTLSLALCIVRHRVVIFVLNRLISYSYLDMVGTRRDVYDSWLMCTVT